MTYSRTLIVLAKSIKKGDFCIAGKDTSTLEWIRPVKDCPFTGEELCNLSNHNDQVKFCDIVEMSFKEKVPKDYQPENELVDMNKKWRYVGDYQSRNLDTYIDMNKNSLLDQVRSHSIHKSKISGLYLQNSLQLIKITKMNNAKVVYQSVFYSNSYKARLEFIFEGISYSLPITDPSFPPSPQRRKPENIKNAYITIGIGEEYKNNHYFLVVMLKRI